MSQDWYLLNDSPPVYNSGFEQDEFDNYATSGFNELLSNSPLSDEITILNSDLSVNKTLRAIVQNTTSDSSVSSLDRQILAPIGTLKTGTYISCRNKLWLVTGLIDNNKIYEKTIAKYCNLLLRWQNKSGQIVSRWCVAENATKYSSGVIDGKIITQPELQFNIKLPMDNETKNLRRGKRFLDSVEDIDGNPTAYKLTQRDTISNNYDENNRILNITLMEDAFNSEVDNKELLIADYFSPAPIVEGQAEIIYTGKPQIYVGGSWKYFSPLFKDMDGNILDGIIPVWSLTTVVGQENKFIFESLSDGRCRLKCIMDAGLIGSKVKVILEDTGELYRVEVLVEVVDY